jgi:hypothetical protein
MGEIRTITKSYKTRPYDEFEAVCRKLNMEPNAVADLIGYSGAGTAHGWSRNGRVPEVALHAARGMLDQRTVSGDRTILMVGPGENAQTLVKVAEGLGFRAAVL